MADQERKSGIIGSALKVAAVAAVVAAAATPFHKGISSFVAKSPEGFFGKAANFGVKGLTGRTGVNTSINAIGRVAAGGAAAGAVIGGYNVLTGQAGGRAVVGSHTARLSAEQYSGERQR